MTMLPCCLYLCRKLAVEMVASVSECAMRDWSQVLKCATNDDQCTLKVSQRAHHRDRHRHRHYHHLHNHNHMVVTITQATDEADKLTLMFESKEGDR